MSTPRTFSDAMAMDFTDVQKSIADSAMRVIATRGFDVVSVRTVAEESGISAGTVQYHFPTRVDMLVAALIRSFDRQSSRVDRKAPADTVQERIIQSCLEFVPIDDERLEECIVWVAFGAAAPTRDWLAQLYAEALGHFRRIATEFITASQLHGLLDPNMDAETSGRLIAALVNGLTIDYINATQEERAGLEHDLRIGILRILGEPHHE